MISVRAAAIVKVTSLLELGVLALLSWLFIWRWGPQITSYPATLMAVAYLAVLFYIAYLSPVWIHADDRRSWGLGGWKTLLLRTDNLGRALQGFGTITAVGGAVIVLAALWRNPSVFQQLDWRVFFLKFSCYSVSGAIQGCVTLFVLMRLADLFSCDPFQPGGGSVEINGRLAITALVSGYFSLMHAPNVPVMLVTLVLTPPVLWQYFKTPNLFLLIGTHAVLGTLLHRVYELPMRIGPFYTSPDRYIIRELFPIVARIIGNSW